MYSRVVSPRFFCGGAHTGRNKSHRQSGGPLTLFVECPWCSFDPVRVPSVRPVGGVPIQPALFAILVWVSTHPCSELSGCCLFVRRCSVTEVVSRCLCGDFEREKITSVARQNDLDFFSVSFRTSCTVRTHFLLGGEPRIRGNSVVGLYSSPFSSFLQVNVLGFVHMSAFGGLAVWLLFVRRRESPVVASSWCAAPRFPARNRLDRRLVVDSRP